jgi:hypothetical protein
MDQHDFADEERCLRPRRAELHLLVQAALKLQR